LKENIKYINPIRRPVANLVVLMFVLIGASTAAPQMIANLNSAAYVVIFVVVLHVVILSICFLYAWITHLKKENIPPLIFCSSQKTVTSSLMIWDNYFSEFFMAPIVIVFYHLVQIIIDSIIADCIAKHLRQEV